MPLPRPAPPCTRTVWPAPTKPRTAARTTLTRHPFPLLSLTPPTRLPGHSPVRRLAGEVRRRKEIPAPVVALGRADASQDRVGPFFPADLDILHHFLKLRFVHQRPPIDRLVGTVAHLEPRGPPGQPG